MSEREQKVLGIEVISEREYFYNVAQMKSFIVAQVENGLIDLATAQAALDKLCQDQGLIEEWKGQNLHIRYYKTSEGQLIFVPQDDPNKYGFPRRK